MSPGITAWAGNSTSGTRSVADTRLRGGQDRRDAIADDYYRVVCQQCMRRLYGNHPARFNDGVGG